MKANIIDFLMHMGYICDKHIGSDGNGCLKCPLHVEEKTFHGCLKDDMNNRKHAEIIKKVVLREMI